MKQIYKFLSLLLFIHCSFTAKAQFGYVDKLSIQYGDIDSVYINTNIHPVGNYIYLYNLQGKIVDSAMVINHLQDTTHIDSTTLDYHYQPTAVYHCNLKKSGIYFWENSIIMIVRSNIPKPITIVYPTNTCNAYSKAGGKSMYTTPWLIRASFHRPIYTINSYAFNGFLWLSKTTIDSSINYISDLDLEDSLTLKNTNVLFIPGHNEYWTRKARNNFDEFIQRGKNALVASGNTMWWQVRYEDNNKILTCYKSAKRDTIQNVSLKTVLWNDSILNYPTNASIGADFSLVKYGNYPTCGFKGFKIIHPCSPLFKNIVLKSDSVIIVKTREYDGFPLYFNNGKPIQNFSFHKYFKSELVGYDKGCNTTTDYYGTFHVFQKTKTSGKIIQIGSTDYFSRLGIGWIDSVNIQKLTINCLNLLSTNSELFCKPTNYIILKKSVCPSTSFSFNGHTLNTAGTYYDTLINKYGSDSIIELNLSLNTVCCTPIITPSILKSICSGDTFWIDKTPYTTSGTFNFKFDSYLGCDSIVTLNLTVKPKSTKTINASICQGSRYYVGTNSYAIAGSYVNHLTTYLGCDSAVTLNLIVKSTSAQTINTSICQGANYTVGTNNYTTSGTYVNHFTNAQGCDSTVTLNLIVKPTSAQTINASICQGANYTVGSNTYSTNGTYVNHFTNTQGCDSLITLNLVVRPSIFKEINDTICKGQPYTFANLSIQQAGTYLDTLTSFTNCDSILQLNLFYTNSFHDSLIHGSVLVTHSDTNHYFIQPDNLIHYQWNITGGNLLTNADTNAIAITWNNSGTSNPTIELISIDKWGCADTLIQMLEWNTNGIKSLNKAIIAEIFPNPMQEEVNINFNSSKERIVLIYDMKGVLIREERINQKKNKIHVTNKSSSGIYDLVIKESGLPSFHYKLVQTN